MCLASNIINRFSVLLPHGRKLGEPDINALKRKFPDLWVQVFDPLLDDVCNFDDNTRDQEVSLQVRQNMAVLSKRVSDTVRAGTALTTDNVSGLQNAIDEMIQYLQDNPVSLALVEQTAGWDGYLQEHSANVFYLSMIVGNTIRNYIKREREKRSAAKNIHGAMKLNALGMAALIHDIGMVPLDEITKKTEPLTPEEIALIKAHPLAADTMLPPEIDPLVKQAVRTHHENYDGSGYTENLTGDQIPIFARIIRIADAYSAGIAQKRYSQAKTAPVVLHEMLHGNCQHLYDPVVLKMFSGIVQPFPIGAKLQLDSGRCAVVVRHNLKDPFNPEIVVAFDSFGDPLEKEALDGPFSLAERPDIKPVSFGNQELRFLHSRYPKKDQETADKDAAAEVFDLVYP